MEYEMQNRFKKCGWAPPIPRFQATWGCTSQKSNGHKMAGTQPCVRTMAPAERNPKQTSYSDYNNYSNYSNYRQQ